MSLSAEVPFALAKLKFLEPLRRTIPHDLHKAVSGPQRHHQTGSPEPGSVLALMPSLVFAAARPSCCRTLALWSVCGTVLGRKNHVAGAAEDFLFGVPSETLGSDIPRDYIAAQTQQNH